MRTSVMVAIAVLTATCMLQIGSPLERPAFAADAVHFPTTADDHATLTGYLSHPNGSGPYPAVIFLPGCDGKLTDIDRVYDSVFAGQNYVVLSLDTHGSRHLGDTCGRSESVLSALTQAKDAIGANVYLRTLSYVGPNRIVVIGAEVRHWWRAPRRSRPPSAQPPRRSGPRSRSTPNAAISSGTRHRPGSRS